MSCTAIMKEKKHTSSLRAKLEFSAPFSALVLIVLLEIMCPVSQHCDMIWQLKYITESDKDRNPGDHRKPVAVSRHVVRTLQNNTLI